MPLQDELLKILADGQYHSGAGLGKQLSISRAAVWKRVQQLLKSGVVIQAVKGRGYRITQTLELLDQNILLRHLDARTRARISQLTLHQTTDSTNQYLLDQIPQDIHRHFTLTEYQTAGRGRRGRSWVSPFASGICMSVGWQFDPAPDPVGVIPLAAGVAVMRALERTGVTGASLKWPNDVLWQDQKLGGILVEMRMETAGPCHIVIGIGLNYSLPRDVTGSMESIELPWIDLACILKQVPSRNQIAATLIMELMRILEAIEHGDAQSIIECWRAYDSYKGRQVCLLLPNQKREGRVLGIDQQGALLMSVNGRIERFNSGEISLRSRS